MNERLNALTQAVRQSLRRPGGNLARLGKSAGRVLVDSRTTLIAVAAIAAAGYLVWSHPPVQTVPRGDVGVRINQMTGGVAEFRDGSVFVVPGLHELRRYPLRDQVWQPAQGRSAGGESPFQSVEGLSLGVDLSIRYALDPARIAAMSRNLPDDIGGEVVQPAVQGTIYKVYTRYTVREIFSSKRAEIQQAIEAELKPKLAADGIVLRSVTMGKVDLPADYRRGMDALLAEELQTEKMRYTLELKAKQVQQSELEAEADRVRREKSATAAGNEQVIAARAQEEAMKHVLPFKQKQIEQRRLEAEAEKESAVRRAEGSAQARRIEAAGEAESRQKLADAEAYRLDRVGRIQSEQMAREGVLITRHPLLIQKTVADKLSDKIQVIIAPPSTDGKFIASGLIGRLDAAPAANDGAAAEADAEGGR